MQKNIADGIFLTLKSFFSFLFYILSFFLGNAGQRPWQPECPLCHPGKCPHTLTALSPTVGLYYKPGGLIVRSWCDSSLRVFTAVLIFVYRGGSSFMFVGIVDSLDFSWVFWKSSHLITYYDCKLLSQVKS